MHSMLPAPILMHRHPNLYSASVPCRENGYEDRITLLRGRVEEVELPVHKVQLSPYLVTASGLSCHLTVSRWIS